ncbi:hypothetical protein JHC42_00060 [Pseudomonas sp. OA3]|nr:hypothetical protein [Pseudomonas sp. OA3]
MILFLDIDGVLHPLFPRRDRPATESAPLAYLPRLASVLRDYPHVQLVISSTWRITRSLDQLKLLFPDDLQHRVIGATPALEEGSRPGGREWEALSWLDAHPQHTEWLALDDCAPCWSSLWRVVLCEDGFRNAEESALRGLLSNT